MVLGQLQTFLSDIYALDVAYDVRDFLVTDARIASALDAEGRQLDEKLLIAEKEGEASVSLYVDAGVVQRLGKNNPASRLSQDNLEDFWTALEGVSHFLYYVWNAVLEKSVTLLEMELQAEVDKFIGAAVLLREQGGRLPSNLHSCLFDLPRFDSRLDAEELDRYRSANRYAGKYCMRLAPRLAANTDPTALRSELCYFYRLPQPGKLQHIDGS
jgi:hypothetical protein